MKSIFSRNQLGTKKNISSSSKFTILKCGIRCVGIITKLSCIMKSKLTFKKFGHNKKNWKNLNKIYDFKKHVLWNNHYSAR